MTAHIHAENMRLYAEDAAETNAPWIRWEYRIWPHDQWRECESNPIWNGGFEYRRKPRTIMINGHEVPEPLRKAPEIGEDFFVPELDGRRKSWNYTWDNDAVDKANLALGLCHSTREAAEAHAKALLSFTEAK